MFYISESADGADMNGAVNKTPLYLLQGAMNIMIPVEAGRKEYSHEFFLLYQSDIPLDSQQNMNDITGTPFKPEMTALKVHKTPVNPDLDQKYIRTLLRLADAVDRCDMRAHSITSSLWVKKLALAAGLTSQELENLKLAGRLHDIGKGIIPRETLVKPGPLSHDEWVSIKRHPEYSAMLMQPSALLADIQPLVRHHHEHYDGSGYPDGLYGDGIPLGARILAIVDAFATMIGGRAYRKPITKEDALKELVRCRGTQFDPQLVDYMVKLIFPPG